jgi:glycosyltransferase involved in cell wall biosynthesis
MMESGEAAVPKISFIIPHKDDPLIHRLLDSLSKQTSQEFEIIVVDSSDIALNLNKWKQQLNLQTVFAKCGRGTARNIGAKIAAANILVFVDADVVLLKTFVNKLVKTFERDPELVAVGFPIYPTKSKKIPNNVYRFLRFLDEFSYHYGKPRIPTTCAAYKRSILQCRRFLDIVGEDVLFSADIPKYGKACFAKEIRVFEEPRRWDRSGETLKSVWHYIPAFATNLLILLGLHNSMMPKQENKR